MRTEVTWIVNVPKTAFRSIDRAHLELAMALPICGDIERWIEGDDYVFRLPCTAEREESVAARLVERGVTAKVSRV